MHSGLRWELISSAACGPAILLLSFEMSDHYMSWGQMAADNKGQFSIEENDREKDVVIIVPHGGSTEPGTSEIARGLESGEQSSYYFEGKKSSENFKLHITSTASQGEQLDKLVPMHRHCVAIHGAKDCIFQAKTTEKATATIIGGKDTDAGRVIAKHLQNAGFEVLTPDSPRWSEIREDLKGVDDSNICNRTATSRGLQLEITESQRKVFFQGNKLKSWTDRQQTTADFDRYVVAVKAALLELEEAEWKNEGELDAC
jgi:phage replication-related protein YjqB (UPF0714/DUF867 family)